MIEKNVATAKTESRTLADSLTGALKMDGATSTLSRAVADSAKEVTKITAVDSCSDAVAKSVTEAKSVAEEVTSSAEIANSSTVAEKSISALGESKAITEFVTSAKKFTDVEELSDAVTGT